METENPPGRYAATHPFLLRQRGYNGLHHHAYAHLHLLQVPSPAESAHDVRQALHQQAIRAEITHEKMRHIVSFVRCVNIIKG